MNNGIRESLTRNSEFSGTINDLLSCATHFRLSDSVQIVWAGAQSWMVLVEGYWALNKQNQLEYQPSPSNRTETFIQNTRYDFAMAWRQGTLYAIQRDMELQEAQEE